ncbi:MULTISPECIES: RcnB family protein [unclassified Caballeronia]|uniref:RcnB family protein n=1 Tax=unclassified Caballeronia TaxID=2646786 RepID=UPI00286792E8|nr:MULTISPECIES: RcnB family protein [unclassified Caballeronia]MDR5739891.1 RcnB family protein [Caballeronia sp. LZ016]MDR5808356.1 RcnB family protein [Caballeronia sp. LZ019]
MKKNQIVAVLLCAGMAFGAGASVAQPSHGGPDHGNDRGNEHGNGHGPDRAPGRAPVMNGHDAPRPQEHADHDRGHPDWRKGDRLSADYRNRQYVVDDWHGHGLRQPPRGYQWVGVGADYLLVAVGTGLIAQVVLSQ